MRSIANLELPVLPLFQSAFTTAATFARAKLLGVAAILTTGRRTVTNLLRTVAGLAEGDPSSYRRVLSLAQWSGLTLAAILTRFVIRHFWPQGRIRLVGDDTVTEHPGRKVNGKARHRDSVRSSHSYTAWRWGHKWVVLAILVQFPFATRPWALPVFVALYRSPQVTSNAVGRTRPRPSCCNCSSGSCAAGSRTESSSLRAMRVMAVARRPRWHVARRGRWTSSASFLPTPTCMSRPHLTRAMADPGSRARNCPVPERSWPRRSQPGGTWAGTAGAGATWTSSAARGIGIRRGSVWWRSAGCTCRIGPARTARSTSTAPMRP